MKRRWKAGVVASAAAIALILGAFVVTQSGPVEHVTHASTIGAKEGGGGDNNIVVPRDETLSYSAAGANFTVYVVTNEELNSFGTPQGFGYIAGLSTIDSSGADVHGAIGPGIYNIILVNHDNSTPASVSYSISYTTSGISVPWDIIGAVAVTAVVTASISYLIMRGQLLK